jgi:hypothetical protein
LKKFLNYLDIKFKGEKMKVNEQNNIYFEDGEPCPHPGCKNHITHPCEVCGRIAAQGKSKEFSTNWVWAGNKPILEQLNVV